jgi:hypothetical protein
MLIRGKRFLRVNAHIWMVLRAREQPSFYFPLSMVTVINRVINRFRLGINVLLKGSLKNQDRDPIPAITPEEILEAREFFPLDKFFIFGHARSGTTLLTRLIRLHPDAHCNYQGHFFSRYPTIEALVNRTEIETWFKRRSNRWNRGRDLSPIVLRAVVDFIMEREARPLGVKVVGDKSPNSLMNGDAVKLLHKFYPDSKLIFILRDGRDAAISHRFQTFIDATQHLTNQDWAIRSDFERDPNPYLLGKRSVFTQQGIRSAAEGWVKNVLNTIHQGEMLFKDQFVALRYEDLLKNPIQVMNRLWIFLDLDVDRSELKDLLQSELASNPDKVWQKQVAGELVSSLKKGKTGSWRDLFTERDKEIFKEIAGDTLISWGYEKNLQW